MSSSLHQLAREGRTEDVDKRLNIGDMTKSQSLVNVTDKHRRTPLHLAAFFGHSDTVTKLLEYKANLHAGAVDGFTALHFAAQNGHTDTCKVLLMAKANIDRSTDRGMRTALHLAAFKGHQDVMELLIRKKANIGKKNSDGKTALDLIADSEVANEMKLLANEIEEQINSKKRKQDSDEEQNQSKLHKLDEQPSDE